MQARLARILIGHRALQKLLCLIGICVLFPQVLPAGEAGFSWAAAPGSNWLQQPIRFLATGFQGGSPTPANGPADEPGEFSSARQFLEFLGVGSSELGDLVDDKPWQEHENRVLHRLLFHLERHFEWRDLERWASRSLGWKPIVAQPDTYRGDVVYAEGTVFRVEAVELPVELAERLGFRRYFRAELKLATPGEKSAAKAGVSSPADGGSGGEAGTSVDKGASPQPREAAEARGLIAHAVVFSLDLPQAWLRRGNLCEPCAVYGLFLKKEELGEGSPRLYFAAKRIAWYPETILGRLRMDVGLFDLLDRPLPGQSPSEGRGSGKIARLRLGAHNRECFYQLLAAVGRAAPGQLLREARQQLAREGHQFTSVVPLFNEPASQRGKLVLLSGTARDVLRVDVPDRDIRARFALTHYFQVHLFTEDSQGNPLVVCVRELPPGMPIGSGQNYAESVTVAGFFFNTWAYRRQGDESASEGQVLWQLAPLIIGRDLVWHPRPPEGAGPWVTLLATLVFLVVLFAIWWGMLQTIRSPKPPAKEGSAGTPRLFSGGEPGPATPRSTDPPGDRDLS
ncbi:MAG: hypothetical protein NZ899_12150 [Thermoguttaceae bacterium]|nr:hypothetical protein [Thermoguttaceae bacterium]MDW8079584.1 hypothetical protein [Thermoguttaceae bacterium]